MRLAERIRIGIVGLGWVGQEVARAALEDPRVTLVGVADSDPMKAGRDLGEIIGEGRLGIPIDPDVATMLGRARPEVAVVCTTSDVEALGPTLEDCLDHGAHVVTTCENLADGELAVSQLPPGFDERARDAGLVVLATGVNPGFAMDRLPVMLAQVTRNIRRIRVSRVVNASTRRAQLQAKIGVGMTPHGFGEAIRAGEVGHAGLSSSLRLIAKGLGIPLDKTAEAFTPVLAASPTASVLGAVPSGRVRGVYQIARGYRARREVITLELTMALDEPNPRDTIDIVGEPPIHFEGELPGDACTVAAVLSAISVVVTMPPGLRTVLDVPLEQPEEPPAPARPQLVRELTVLPTLAPQERRARAQTRVRDAEITEEVPILAPTELPTPLDDAPAAKKKATGRARAEGGGALKKATPKKKATTQKKRTTKKKATKKRATKKKAARSGVEPDTK
ncbi:MAG: hypothetical protein KC933_32570 [Myxococcales bacterium]|nr:hypothetical protein [Myxococcales bacterium]MCB9650344.1 dihydrodipicolinate reductase [Deltaproteobacteria bacterium]